MAFAGLLLHGATVALYAPVGLVAPSEGVFTPLTAWFLLLFVGLCWWRYNSPLTLTIPVMSIGVWLDVLLFGDRYLGGKA